MAFPVINHLFPVSRDDEVFGRSPSKRNLKFAPFKEETKPSLSGSMSVFGRISGDLLMIMYNATSLGDTNMSCCDSSIEGWRIYF